MSASLPKNSLFHRLNKTPLRDLFRGQITARLDLAGKIARAALPADAGALIQQTVRRTRLHRFEKISVADELIGHFRDALAQGVTPADAARDFGDPATAARLIRRAKKRQRSLAWKLFSCAVIGVAALTVVATVQIGPTFWAFPTPQTDYLAILNAPAAAVPEPDRAWPVYRKAWLKAGFNGELLDELHNPAVHAVGGIRWPGDPGWDETRALLSRLDPMLRTVRSATSLPGLGHTLTYNETSSPANATLFDAGATHPVLSADTDEDHLRNSSLAAISTSYLSLIRRQSQLLLADLGHAADLGDFPSVLANVDALMGLARHAGELRHPGTMFVSLRMHDDAFTGIQALLTRYPDSFTLEQLQTLSNRVRQSHPEKSIDYTVPRVMVLDQLQRIFADDGQGTPTAAGVRLLGFNALSSTRCWVEYPSGNGWFALSNGVKIARIAQKLPTGSQAHHLLDRAVTSFLGDAHRPMHQLPVTNIEAEFGKPHNSAQPVYELVAPYLSSAAGLRHWLAWTQAKRAGTLIALALESHRLQHGHYPVTLHGLVPEYLPALPVDPITGGPLHYLLDRGRPLVYSVGCDRDDDGGTPPIDVNGTPASHLASMWDPDHADDPMRDGDWLLYDGRLPTAVNE